MTGDRKTPVNGAPVFGRDAVMKPKHQGGMLPVLVGAGIVVLLVAVLLGNVGGWAAALVQVWG